MDHSFFAGRLVHGFDIGVMIELFARPEFGSMQAAQMPAMYFAFLFFLATALFLPGVFQGYASTYRLPRTEFFRACGRNSVAIHPAIVRRRNRDGNRGRNSVRR